MSVFDPVQDPLGLQRAIQVQQQLVQDPFLGTWPKLTPHDRSRLDWKHHYRPGDPYYDQRMLWTTAYRP